jgi:hypothetical protein
LRERSRRPRQVACPRHAAGGVNDAGGSKDDAAGGGELVLSVLVENGGRVLRVWREEGVGVPPAMDLYARGAASTSATYTAKATATATTAPAQGSDGPSSNAALATAVSRTVGVSFSLASLGVSLVVEKPTRREMLSLYVDGLEGRLKIWQELYRRVLRFVWVNTHAGLQGAFFSATVFIC